jgi:hypothetical protein
MSARLGNWKPRSSVKNKARVSYSNRRTSWRARPRSSSDEHPISPTLNMRRDIGRWIVTVGFLVAIVGACDANKSANASHTSATTGTVQPRPSGVPLYEQFESASSPGPTGEPVNATLVGARYPSSTGMWIGCEGVAAEATFRLDRRFTQLTAVVGLQPHTPDGVAARITISADGHLLSEFTVRKTATNPIDLVVDRTDSLVVAAILEEGTCEPSDSPYGALGNAVLTSLRD